MAIRNARGIGNGGPGTPALRRGNRIGADLQPASRLRCRCSLARFHGRGVSRGLHRPAFYKARAVSFCIVLVLVSSFISFQL